MTDKVFVVVRALDGVLEQVEDVLRLRALLQRRRAFLLPPYIGTLILIEKECVP